MDVLQESVVLFVIVCWDHYWGWEKVQRNKEKQDHGRNRPGRFFDHAFSRKKQRRFTLLPTFDHLIGAHPSGDID